MYVTITFLVHDNDPTQTRPRRMFLDAGHQLQDDPASAADLPGSQAEAQGRLFHPHARVEFSLDPPTAPEPPAE